VSTARTVDAAATAAPMLRDVMTSPPSSTSAGRLWHGGLHLGAAGHRAPPPRLSHTVGDVTTGSPGPTATRQRPLRRYRESVCFAVATCLYLIAWAAVRGGYAAAPHGDGLLAGLGAAEAASLALLFWLQQSRRTRMPAIPWISIAWRTLPAWVVLEVLIGVILARHQG
jgi:hypothetical protein